MLTKSGDAEYVRQFPTRTYFISIIPSNPFHLFPYIPFSQASKSKNLNFSKFKLGLSGAGEDPGDFTSDGRGDGRGLDLARRRGRGLGGRGSSPRLPNIIKISAHSKKFSVTYIFMVYLRIYSLQKLFAPYITSILNLESSKFYFFLHCQLC